MAPAELDHCLMGGRVLSVRSPVCGRLERGEDPMSRSEAGELIQDYGKRHPESFGGVRWNDDHYVVSFTDRLDAHRTELRALVADPSMIEVDPAGYTGAYLRRIGEEIRAELRHDPRRVLRASGPGTVTLRAPFAAVAADLHVRYGDALDITVGTKPFPPERIVDPPLVRLPVSTIDLPDLVLDFDIGEATVAPGDDLSGTVTLTNQGRERLRFLSGAAVGSIRQPGSDHLSGTFHGWMSSVGLNVDLQHAQSTDLPLIVGTTSCLPDRSYVVEPARYELVVAVSVNPVDEHHQPFGHQTLVRVGPELVVTA